MSAASKDLASVADLSRVADVAALPTPTQPLDAVLAYLRRFVVYPSVHAAVAHALWVVHTHLMDAWESTPRIAFLSPEPGSGKSRALEVCELLVPGAVNAVNVSVAYLFRKVGDEEGRPTILYDEVDTVFTGKGENEDIRGLLNAGHRKHSMVGRCVVRGKNIEPEETPAYCAVALAGLGDLPDTLMSRSVIVRMRRRAPGEAIQPYRRREAQPVADKLRYHVAAWADAIRQSIEGKWPDFPADVADRDADVWEALLVVADAAARAAASALVAEAKQRAPSLGVRLLGDLRIIFGNADRMTTEAILKALHTLDEAPWADLRGKGLDARALAQMLRKYSIASKNLRHSGDAVSKGYERADLADAWARYLPPPDSLLKPEPATAATAATAGVSGGVGGAAVAHVAAVADSRYGRESRANDDEASF
jgi:hypothetical protein